MTHDLLLKLPALKRLETIDLSEMKAIKLMNRIDTKYMANVSMLNRLLELAVPNYRIQEVENEVISSYDTIYYDTPDCAMYLLHHNRHLQRQKIRTRTYIASQLSFLEIKNKTNKGRTKKIRTKIDSTLFPDFRSNTEANSFIELHSPYNPIHLLPQVRTSFDRITLVNKNKTERLTIDTNLRFENLTTHHTSALNQLMIIELKQDGLCESEMKQILQKLRIVSGSVSKYCVGMALTNPGIKTNRFKRKLHIIEKIEQTSNT